MKTLAAVVIALSALTSHGQGACGLTCAQNDALGLKKPSIVSHLPLTGDASDPVAGMSLWLDFGDPQQVFQDAGLTTPAVADNAPVRGVKDKSGHNRNMAMSGGFDPLLWRSVLRGCDLFRHDAVFPRLASVGWTVGDVCGSGSACTIFLVGQVPSPMVDNLVLASEGYTSLNYTTNQSKLIGGIWNGSAYDNAVREPVAQDSNTHIVMMRVSVGQVDVAIDNFHNDMITSMATTGMDAASLAQILTTSYGPDPYTSRYQTLLIYPTALSEADAVMVGSWAHGRWGTQ